MPSSTDALQTPSTASEPSAFLSQLELAMLAGQRKHDRTSLERYRPSRVGECCSQHSRPPPARSSRNALRLALDEPEPDKEAAFAAILEDLLTCAGAAPH